MIASSDVTKPSFRKSSVTSVPMKNAAGTRFGVNQTVKIRLDRAVAGRLRGSGPCRGLRSTRSPSWVGIPSSRSDSVAMCGSGSFLCAALGAIDPGRRGSVGRGAGSERDRARGAVDVDDASCRLGLGHDPAMADDPAGRRSEPDRLRLVRAVEDDEVRRQALLHPVWHLGRAGRIGRDHLVGPEQLGPAGHLGDVDEHRERVEHRAASERIPRIHDRVVAAGHVDARPRRAP